MVEWEAAFLAADGETLIKDRHNITTEGFLPIKILTMHQEVDLTTGPEEGLTTIPEEDLPWFQKLEKSSS